MAQAKVFIDSDVIISSLLSASGAAHLLLTGEFKNVNFFIANISYQELKIVAKRLKIKKEKLESLVKKRFKIVNLKESVAEIKRKYKKYTFDPNDAHIIAGAARAKANFLLTYNLRHFKVDKIKKDFKIILLTPANFLQYLRSQD